MLQVHNDGLHQRCHMTLLVSLFETLRNVLLAAWCENGTRTPGLRTSRLGTWDPPQSLKVGLQIHLKFNSGTPGPHSKFKSETPGCPSKFKSGTPSYFFNEFILFRIFHCFFYFFIFASLLNKIYTKIIWIIIISKIFWIRYIHISTVSNRYQ